MRNKLGLRLHNGHITDKFQMAFIDQLDIIVEKIFTPGGLDIKQEAEHLEVGGGLEQMQLAGGVHPGEHRPRRQHVAGGVDKRAALRRQGEERHTD